MLKRIFTILCLLLLVSSSTSAGDVTVKYYETRGGLTLQKFPAADWKVVTDTNALQPTDLIVTDFWINHDGNTLLMLLAFGKTSEKCEFGVMMLFSDTRLINTENYLAISPLVSATVQCHTFKEALDLVFDPKS